MINDDMSQTGQILAARQQAYSKDGTEEGMSVARVTKITAASPKSFDDALRNGAERAAKTIRGITGLHLIDQKAKVERGKIAEFRVTMEVTFILEE